MCYLRHKDTTFVNMKLIYFVYYFLLSQITQRGFFCDSIALSKAYFNQHLLQKDYSLTGRNYLIYKE